MTIGTEATETSTDSETTEMTIGTEATETPTDSETTEMTAESAAPSRDGATALDARLDAFDHRLTAVEAELEAVRGLLDGVDAVDEAVDRRASLALAKVERLERTLDDGERGLVRERIPETEPTKSRGRTDDTASPEAADSDLTSDQGLGAGSGPEYAIDPGRARGDDAGPTGGSAPGRGSGSLYTADEPDENRPGEESLASRLRDAFR